MMVLIVIALGVTAFFRIPVDLLPDLTFPVVAIYTEYEGVGPEEIENSITKLIEGAASRVDGVKELRSTSERGVSIVTVEFDWGTNMDFAVQNIREEIDQIPDFMFPDDSDKPRIVRYDPSDIPLMGVGISGGGNTAVQLQKITEDYIEDPVTGVEGVASVMVFGGMPREILVTVDQDKLTAAGMSLDTVVGRLKGENFNLSVGNLKEGYKDYLVRALGEFESLSEIEDIVLGAHNGNTIRLKDIARVYDTFEEDVVIARDNLRPTAMMMLLKQSGSNTVDVSKHVWEKLDELKPHLPSGIELTKNFDTADFINRAIGDVWSTLFWGGLLAVIVLFMFLHHVRPVVIIAVAIPTSLLAAFLPMFFAGMTINMISLGGLALAVGMVVDNSIVVLENIFRHIEEKGEDRMTASRKGASEVGMAITASTLTTVAVFIPIVFTTGLASRIFRDLALTVTFSLLSSLFIALTLVPMMASKLLAAGQRRQGEGRLFKSVKEWYRGVISWVLNHKLITLGATNILWVSAIAILIIMGKEFMPTANDETFMVEIELPRGTRLEETNRLSERIENLLLETPEVRAEHAVIGHSASSDSLDSRGAFYIVNLVDQSKRTRTVEQVNDDIRRRVLQIPGIVTYNFVNLQSRSLGGGGGKPIEVKIFGQDLADLSKLSHEVAAEMRAIEGVVDVEETFQFGNPEMQIHFDRERMAQLGLGTTQVAQIMETAVKGTVASRYRELGEEFDIRVRLEEEDRNSLLDLRTVTLTSATGAQIRVADIADVELGSGPVRIFRDDQKRSVSILANTLEGDYEFKRLAAGVKAAVASVFNGEGDFFGKLKAGYRSFRRSRADLNTVVEEIQQQVSQMTLPLGYYIEYGGSYEDMRESQVQLVLAFLLGALLVYMIIAALFESLIHPFTIMFSVPFAFTGSIWALFLTGMTLSVNSAIGIVMLSGIIVNNGIVLIDYVNQLRAEGMEIKEALIEAGATRLRPILMTTLTTILGLIPMAVISGAGSEMRRPLAVSLIGGLAFGSLLTLFVIPTAYYVYDNLAQRIYLLFMRILHPKELAAGGASAGDPGMTKK
jgi:HAE1 family hydrophobic/amphiphilic exporter-1